MNSVRHLFLSVQNVSLSPLLRRIGSQSPPSLPNRLAFERHILYKHDPPRACEQGPLEDSCHFSHCWCLLRDSDLSSMVDSASFYPRFSFCCAKSLTRRAQITVKAA
jgi:hypothetical protein